MKNYIGIAVAILAIVGLFIVLGMQNRGEQMEDTMEVSTSEASDRSADETSESDSGSSYRVGQFDPEDQAKFECVNHGSEISMHIHPTVAIYIEGDPVAIPTDIGISEECMSAIHTHDGTGAIHIEYPEQRDFTLGDFFAVWGGEFNEGRVMDMVANFEHPITMKVDGEPSDAFENLILEDGQLIEIFYE